MADARTEDIAAVVIAATIIPMTASTMIVVTRARPERLVAGDRFIFNSFIAIMP
jgi:hypothetical protein